jgi:hypothetical protein
MLEVFSHPEQRTIISRLDIRYHMYIITLSFPMVRAWLEEVFIGSASLEVEHSSSTPYCAPTRELSRRLFDILLRTALPSLDILTRRPRKTACTRTMASMVCNVVAACLRTWCPRTNA